MHMDATESTGTGVAWKAFKEAFPVTLPILAGFWFVAFAYGIYMHAEGFSFWYPFLMAACIFGGSLEFVTVAMLLSPFAPFQALMVALMIQARHFFYGIAMLEKYGHMGWKKPFLIFMMCDETFALNYAGSIPRSVDRGWYMLWISVLNYLYWVSGALLGGLLGNVIPWNIKGIGFVMTTMFVVIFLEQLMEEKQHITAVIGAISAVLCRILFGADNFLLPTMFLILLLLTLGRKKIERRLEWV